MPNSLTFRILGPLEVSRNSEQIVIARGRPRAVLSSLLLGAGEPVSIPKLVDSVWGPGAPPSADGLVRVYISQLRRLLGPDVVLTRPGGYAIADPGAHLDASHFRSLMDAAAARRAQSDRESEAALLEEALSLWSGEVLAGTFVYGEAAAAAARLTDLRLQAVEERADAWLQLGRHRELVPDLEHEVAAAPTRERAVEQLMLALYRNGRQTDALELYAATRRRLVEELGLDPSPRLQELQAQILRHDPTLEPPRPVNESEPKRRRPAAVAAVVAATVAVAAFIAAAIAAGIWLFPGPNHAPRVGSGDLVRIDVPHQRVALVAHLGSSTGSMLVGRRRVWIANSVKKVLEEVDAHTLALERRIPLISVAHAIASAGGAVWLANSFNGTLSRVPADGRVDPPMRPQPHSTGRLALASGVYGLWIGSQDGRLARLDPVRRRVTAVVGNVRTPQGLAIADGAVWVAQATSVTILRVAERSARVVDRIPIGGVPTAIAAAAGAIWALAPEQGKLWRIDPRRNSVIGSYSVPGATLLAGTGSSVWIANARSGIVTRVVPPSPTTLDLQHPLTALAGGPQDLFATTE